MQATQRHALLHKASILGMATLAVLGLVAAHPQAARAQLFSNSSNFSSNLAAGAYTETFNGGNGLAPPSRKFSGGNGYGYTVTSPGPVNAGVYRDSGIISTNNAADSLLFTFTGSPVTAIGGNFFATDINNDVVSSDVTLTLSTGQSITFSTASANTFRGYVSAVPILSLTESVSAGTYATADNLTVGAAAPAALTTPEPGSWAAFAFTGLGGAGLMLRARKRRA